MAEAVRAVEVDRAAAYWSSQADRYQRWGDLAHGHPVYREAWTDALGLLAGHPERDGSVPRRVLAPGGRKRARTRAVGFAGQIPGESHVGDRRVPRWRPASPRLGLGEFHIGDARVALPRVARTWNSPVLNVGLACSERGTRGIVVIDALHFAAPTSVADRARHVAGRAFWTVVGWFDRHRGIAPAPARPATSGTGWRSVTEPASQFAAAGLTGVRRLVGPLPRFYTLTWLAGDREVGR